MDYWEINLHENVSVFGAVFFFCCFTFKYDLWEKCSSRWDWDVGESNNEWRKSYTRRVKSNKFSTTPDASKEKKKVLANRIRCKRKMCKRIWIARQHWLKWTNGRWDEIIIARVWNTRISFFFPKSLDFDTKLMYKLEIRISPTQARQQMLFIQMRQVKPLTSI